MSHDPLGLLNYRQGGNERAQSGHSGLAVVNGGHASRPIEGREKRNYKLLIDPVIKGRGHEKIYRFDGDFEGQPPVIPKDPRSRRTRLWSTRTKADLPVPKFKIDKFYVGIPPQRDVILNGLNDNVDKKFLSDICEKFGQIEGIKIFYDPLTKRHMGKARVGFSTSASAKLAVAKLDGTSIMGCVVHADFEHKVEIKFTDHVRPEKPNTRYHSTDKAVTPPAIEKPPSVIHHVLPTPPPSASSQSPTSSTPPTPGSVGLIDPRTRGTSTSSVSTEKLRSTSPLWPQNPIKQPSKKIGIFEPISPPCQQVVNLLPPPPPEVAPPAVSGRSPSASGGKTSKSFSDKYQSAMRDSKLQDSTSKYSRESLYKGSSRQSKDSDWRRRDRDSTRDRYDDRYESYSSYRSRWSSDGRGAGYSSLQEKESRYSGYKDYASHGRSDSRDGSGRGDPRRSTYSRDKDSRRSRDSDSGSEKGEHKSKYERVSPDARDRSEKKGETHVESNEHINRDADSKVRSDTSMANSRNSLDSNDEQTSPPNTTITLPQSMEDIVPGVEDDNPLSWDLFADQMLELNRTAKLEEQQTDKDSAGNNHVKRPHKAGGTLEPHLPSTESALDNAPIYEDISPVSSPTKTKSLAHAFPAVTHETIAQSLAETSSNMEIDMDKGTNDDNDDAMSLSSISSNEVEVAEPKVATISMPQPSIHYPPPFVPSVPPIPFMPRFDPTIPPPSMRPISMLHPLPMQPMAVHAPTIHPSTIHPSTIHPPTIHPPTIHPPQIPTHSHPLVPQSFHPVFPPQFVPAHTGVHPHMQQPYQVFPTLPSPCEPPKKKSWKTKISEEVLDIVSKELGVILKRDVTKRLVENSAFKALDGWWDNLGKSKLKTTASQPESSATTTTPPSILSSAAPSAMTMTSSPFFSAATMSQGGPLGIGLRASLPKMPSFRRRQPPPSEQAGAYVKRKRDESQGGKSEHIRSDYETAGLHEDASAAKRMRDDVNNGDSVGSPWRQGEDGPPATSVRTEEKHPTVGSSLYYSNVYSSVSESESLLSGDESESSRDEHSDWDESDDESDMSSSEYSSEDEDESKTTKGLPPILPKTPPGTPPETPPATPPRVPRTPSITPPPSPTATEVEGEFVAELKLDAEVGRPEDKEDELGLFGIERDNSSSTTDVTTSEDLKSGASEEDKGQFGISIDKISALKDRLSKEHIDTAQSAESDESGRILPEALPTEVKPSPLPKAEVLEEPEVDVTKVTEDDDVYKPLFELPPEFPHRPYWQDDQLVYDFLVAGLDYEDATYLKVGLENLLQVGSDSVAHSHWAFHPTTSIGVVPKGRKQKSDNCGVRVHASGSARCEGYYNISMNEKAKYLEAARRQVDRAQEVIDKKNEEQGNKAKQQSRENRALQRRLAASFQNEDFGDILKFNHLKVRKKKLTFCKSRIHDWGLFAMEPIGPDEMVIEYVGEVVRQAIADDREKRYERLGIGSSYMFRVDSDTILDATKFGNLARFINHCCEPNCYAKVVTLESEKKIVIYSKRDIAVNEEITYDYKFPIEDEKIPCLCGAAQCRGTLN